MSTLKFDTKDAVSKQNFINLRLAGFSLFDISDALGVSYPTVKRIYDELKPEINSQIAKTKRFDNSALTKKIESFLNALEKHFYIMEEGMIETHNNMNYEQYIASMLKFTNAFEKLVKLRILLNSSQIQQDVSQSNITNSTEPCDPENGSTEYTKIAENVPQSSLIAENDENVTHSSLIAENDENVPQPSLVAENNINDSTDPCYPEIGSSENTENDENVPHSSLLAKNVPQSLSRNLGTSCLRKNTDPCYPENGSTENTENDENVPKSSLIAENNKIDSTADTEPCDPENGSTNNSLKAEDDYPPDKNLIDKDNISYYKYRKLKIAKIRKKDSKYF